MDQFLVLYPPDDLALFAVKIPPSRSAGPGLLGLLLPGLPRASPRTSPALVLAKLWAMILPRSFSFAGLG